MQIFVGADHGGFRLKEAVVAYLRERGYQVSDEGDRELDPEDDFQVYASKVVQAMRASGDNEARGILICTGGQGMAMAANRFRGIRASVIWDEREAKESRHDNDSNVLALPARIVGADQKKWQAIVDSWLLTPFSGLSRYKRRNAALDEL